MLKKKKKSWRQLSWSHQLIVMIWPLGLVINESENTHCWVCWQEWSLSCHGATQEGEDGCWPGKRHRPPGHCSPRQINKYRRRLGWWFHRHPPTAVWLARDKKEKRKCKIRKCSINMVWLLTLTISIKSRYTNICTIYNAHQHCFPASRLALS